MAVETELLGEEPELDPEREEGVVVVVAEPLALPLLSTVVLEARTVVVVELPPLDDPPPTAAGGEAGSMGPNLALAPFVQSDGGDAAPPATNLIAAHWYKDPSEA